ncbi:hypothetical protein DWU98_01315 [Dyella monticola]|uniref:Uncharacterized protein n=1 Tax=Dyella monticola TaxID=1927958 RepID=A0A370X886_9GAMM|nr:hypothetical protein [Dyella monticola]RDS84634.1 hypothetical protein DWU98_01315 [Dyella monticola]
MKKYPLLLCLVLASGAAGAAPSEPPQVVLHGTVTTQSGRYPAWLTLICTQGHGGALSLQLALANDVAPGFPFDAFEGPRAPASFQPSARLAAGTKSFAPVPVSGWYGDAHLFVFGITVKPRTHNDVTAFVAALDSPGMTATWIQASNDIQTPPLMAQFTLDAQHRDALKRIAAPCLPLRYL